MQMTILKFHKDTEETDELLTPVVNIERDSEQFVTLYGEEGEDGLPYIVLDQDVLDELRKLEPKTVGSGQVEVEEVDNRDSRTTWLWFNNHQDYIEVDVAELLSNIHENLIDESGKVTGDPNLAMAIEQVCQAYGLPGYEFT